MTKQVILVAALLLPVVAHADDMMRWRDARGRRHYSNDSNKIPEGATALTNQLGVIGGAPIGPVVESTPMERTPEGRAAPSWGEVSSWGGVSSCVRNLSPYALPQGIVDLNLPSWYYVDGACGPQRDVEGWLRRAAMHLQFREIGL